MEEVPILGKFIDTKHNIEVSRAPWGRGGIGSLMEIEFLFGRMKCFWKWIVVMVVRRGEYV